MLMLVVAAAAAAAAAAVVAVAVVVAVVAVPVVAVAVPVVAVAVPVVVVVRLACAGHCKEMQLSCRARPARTMLNDVPCAAFSRWLAFLPRADSSTRCNTV